MNHPVYRDSTTLAEISRASTMPLLSLGNGSRQLLAGYFATADVFSYDFKEFSYRSEGPLFRYSTLFVDDTMRPLLSSLLERDVLKLASSLDWRITLFFFGGCDCHEGSKRSKCFRIALEGPPSFVRLLFVLFVDEERVSPFYIRIL